MYTTSSLACVSLGSEHRDGLQDKQEKGSALVVAVQAWSSLPREVRPTETSSELSPPPLGLNERPEAECGEQSGTSRSSEQSQDQKRTGTRPAQRIAVSCAAGGLHRGHERGLAGRASKLRVLATDQPSERCRKRT